MPSSLPLTPARDGSISAVLIEDDERLAHYTALYLESHGVKVAWAADGQRGLDETQRVSPDIVLLDLQLPGIDGLSVCRELRARSDVPIVMITARDGEADRVIGLELGADDYLPKPFSSRELLARVRAHVRRARGRTGPRASLIQLGRLVLAPDAMQASLDGQPLLLTGYEFAMLRALAENAGRVLSRERLMLIVKGNVEDAFDRSVDVQISRLRQKLGDDPRNPSLLKTVRGSGYMLAKDT
jgi:DNA-binding response OmpR family regulator